MNTCFNRFMQRNFLMKVILTYKSSEQETDIADTSLTPRKNNLSAKLQ